MSQQSSLILNKKQTLQKIKRLAYEIYENNFQEKDMVFIGIASTGFKMAELLKAEYDAVSGNPVPLYKLIVDKQAPIRSEVTLNCTVDALENKTIMLVDDVMNTGRTLIYSLKPFFDIKIKKLQTVLLVNRNYRLFPIAVDYVGYALATTFQEHITVVLDDDEKFGVYLS